MLLMVTLWGDVDPVDPVEPIRKKSPANRWRTVGNRATILSERNLQISLFLEAGVGPPGVTGKN